MLVRIDVVERQAGGAKRLELRVDFPSQLRAYVEKKKRTPARARFRSNSPSLPISAGISATGNTGHPLTSTR